MIDYGKILKDWQQMSEDDKRRFIYFTYILCDYFGGDINWCDFDGMLSDNEKKFVMDDMPRNLTKIIDEEDYARRVENEKIVLPGVIVSVLKTVSGRMEKEFSRLHLSLAVRKMMLISFKEIIEDVFKTTMYHPEVSFKDDEDELSTVAYVKMNGDYGLRYECFVKYSIVDDEATFNIFNESIDAK